MEEKEESAVASERNPVPKQPDLCVECKKNPSKYKCPGCSLRSCSLPCVNSHKQRTGCTGKRKLSQVIPLSEFDDNLLLSDYHMLEDVKRFTESAKRLRIKLCGYSHFRLPFPLKCLRSAASSRRTKLLFLSSGMLKREKNRSYYNTRKKVISWTIEWRFNSTDVVLIDHGVDENSNLCTLIQNHLQPGPWNHALKKFCDEPLDSLKFFIRKYPKGARSQFRDLDIKAPIREQFANLVILEYPVINVFLPSQNCDFEVIKDVHRQKELKDSVNSDCSSPKGATFREEEIEDKISDTQVSDLARCCNDDVTFRISNPTTLPENRPRKSLDDPPLARGNYDNRLVLQNNACIEKAEDICFGSKTSEMHDLNDMELDFEQGLIDIYPDLISQTNPDDFDLESILREAKDLGESKEISVLGGILPVEEELEEGEIA